MGPATDKEGVVEKLIETGMNVARCNFSHGSYEEHKARMDRLKAARAAAGKPVGILLDTKGPEVRIRDFENGKVELKEGQEFVLYSDEQPGTEKGVSLSYPAKAVEKFVMVNIRTKKKKKYFFIYFSLCYTVYCIYMLKY